MGDKTKIEWKWFCESNNDTLSRIRKTDATRPIKYNGRDFATDGAIAVEINSDDWPGYVVNDQHGMDLSKMSALETIGTVACHRQLPEINGPPEKTNLRWETLCECESCFGRGKYFEYGCKDWLDCEACGGQGYSIDICREGAELIHVCGLYITRRYAWMIAQLPSVRVSPQRLSDAEAMHGGLALRFTSDVGAGLVHEHSPPINS